VALARAAINAAEAAGVNTDFLARGAGRMGLYFLEPGAGARRGRIIYDRADSAFVRTAHGALDWGSALAGASLLHMSGITPALGPEGVALARAAINAAEAAGVPVCLDGNYRAQLWSAWQAEPAAVLRELVDHVAMLIGNYRDIGLMLGREFIGEWPARQREAAAAAFTAFPRLQCVAATERHIVGSDHHNLSARVDLRDDQGQSATIAVTGIIDRIGSGDAFAAGVLHAGLAGGGAQAMADAGLALAVLKHGLPGDMCLFEKEQLTAFNPNPGDVQR